MEITYLLVPGYTNSGPDHWQSYIEKKYANVKRVVQDDWNTPHKEKWVARLNDVIDHTPGEIVLVGHSCGAVAVAQWASRHAQEKVIAAVLVAPADVDAATALNDIRPQRPLPTGRLPLPTLLLCSDNDEHLSLVRAEALAAEWGSDIMMLPGAGHFHTAAGFGEWRAGEKIIEDFTGLKFVPLGRNSARE